MTPKSKITQLTPAPPNTLLTTMRMLQAYLNVPSPDPGQVDMMTHLLQMSSDFVCNYCGRQFAKQRVLEMRPGDGLPDLLLSITPIVEVETVQFDGGAEDTDYIIGDPEAGYLQKQGGWRDTSFWSHYLNDSPTSYAQLKWGITYTGGYVLPGWPTGSGARTLPYDLERACIEIVRSGYKQAIIGADPAMTTYKIGETMASWKQDADFLGGDMAALGIPASAVGILQHYKRPF